MNMLACRCGPRPQSNTFTVTDARRAARFDPTGTLDIRAAFRRQMDSRWSKLRRLALEAIDRNDVLGLAGVTHRSIMVASQSIYVEQIYLGSDKVKAFQSWIDAAMSQVILGDANGSWTSQFIVQAAERATARAEKLTGGSFNNDLNRIRALSSLTVVELQGVMEAVSQQAVRAFTQGMLAKQRPSQVARSVAAVINAIGTIRGRMVVSTMIVKTFSAVTLDAFRSAGVTHVGLMPETLRGAKAVGDAARKTHQARGKGGQFRPYTKMPSAKKIREIIKAEQERVAALSMVEVLTASDELVCFPAFTLVRTSRGDKPIQHIRIGDEVLTRAGFKKVMQTGQRRYAGRLLLVSTIAKKFERIAVSMPSVPVHVTEPVSLVRPLTVHDGAQWSLSSRSSIGAPGSPKPRVMKLAQSLRGLWLTAIRHRARKLWSLDNVPSFVCTSDHPVWCERDGFVPASQLVAGDVLQLIGDERINVGCISDLGFGDVYDRPASSFKELFSAFVRNAVPVSAVNFQGCPADGKVDDISPNLKFLNKWNMQSFKRLPHFGFDRSLAREVAVASEGTKPASCVPWTYANHLAAHQTVYRVNRPPAFFRTMNAVNAAFEVSKRLTNFGTAVQALFFKMFRVGSLALHRAIPIATSGRAASDRKFFIASNTNFSNGAGPAEVVARTRTDSYPFIYWLKYCSAILALDGEALALPQVGAGARAISFVGTCRTAGLGVALKVFAALIAAKSKRHLSWSFCRGLLYVQRALGISPIVYNLTVEGQPEFYANGALVHNCQICEDISSDGPYLIDEAEGLIPAHANCRCAFVPSSDERFAEVEKE